METQIELTTARTARARFVDGILMVRMPADWPEAYRQQTVAKFQAWALRHRAAAASLPAPEPWDGRRWGESRFGDYVRAVNDATLAAPLAGVRIGSAKRSRLAQCNTRTRILTFSRYAIDGMPERALRYLVLHELAHLFEANHSARFWAHVERFEPDYKQQRMIAQAHHARMVEGGGLPSVAEVPAAPPVQQPPVELDDPSDHHPFGPLFAFLPARH